MLDSKLTFLDPSNPLISAHALIEEQYTAGGARTLHHHAGAFYAYTGTHYLKVDPDIVRSNVWHFLDAAYQEIETGELVQFVPNSRRVTEVIDALKAVTQLPSSTSLPVWIRDENRPSPIELVSCQNGLLHLPSRKLLLHTPDFFTPFSIPFAYDPIAPAPIEWLSFLKSIWESDPESIGTLQEIFGYCLTQDTEQQKIFLIIGPKRSGKGTIARILTALRGKESVAAPTLAGLATNFGLAPLIDRPLAIISDARLSGRADQQVIAERLLSISGEDGITIDRKYLPAWTGRLLTRFLIMTNELPRLADASGALAGRFVPLEMTKTFFNQEDHGLEGRLLTELPSILNWALDGKDRLATRGWFEPPASSAEVMRVLEDLGSPISVFLRDKCAVGAGQGVEASALFSAWELWCMTQGRDHSGTAQSFGRDLRAAVPGLKVSQPREGGERRRFYEGVGLQK